MKSRKDAAYAPVVRRKKGGNKGIKAAKDQERRERAYARGATKPTGR